MEDPVLRRIRADPMHWVAARWPRVAGGLLLVLGIVVLVGWILDVARLKAPLTGLASMKANAAAAFALLGWSALAAQKRGKATILPAGGALAIGLLTLAQYVFGLSLGIDELLVKDDLADVATSHAGRMSPMTALGVAAGGLGLLLSRWRRTGRVRALLSIIVLFIATYVLGAYAFDADILGTFTTMAPHTAIGLLVLGPALILIAPEGRVAQSLVSPDLAGQIARRLLPAAFLLPLGLGFLRIRLQEAGWVDTENGAALFAASMVVTLVVLSLLLVVRLRTALDRGDKSAAAERMALQRLTVLSAERRAFFEGNLDMVAVVGFDGRFKDMNRAWETTLGHPLASMVGRPFLEFVHPDDVARTQAEAGRLSATGEPLPFENRYRKADGTYVWLRWTSSASQEHAVFLATAKDVTVERQADEALRAAEARFRLLFDLNPVALAISRSDGGGILDVNPAFETLLGHRKSELGHPDFSLDTVYANPAERVRLLEDLRDRKAADGLQITLRHKDGSHRHVVLSARALELAGKPTFLLALQDVTQARESAILVERARERFERIFRASPMPITLTHDDGRVEDVNEAFVRLTGYPREELLAPGFSARVLYDDPQERDRILLDLRQAGAVRNREIGLRRKDGTVLAVLIVLEFIDLGGNTTILALFQDITSIKAAQRERESRIASEAELERLRKTDAFRTEFINSTAHELATPMTPMVLSLAALQASLGDHPKASASIAMMSRATERMRSVIMDMVHAADLQSRTIAIERRPIDLRNELALAVQAHKSEAQRAHVALDHGGGPPLTVLGDEPKLRLVLGHLIGNAVKFTPPGGRVTVSARTMGGHARVEVTDNGVGLTRKQVELLWKPYSQVHDKSQKTDSGAGLGLYVTKGIIALHGGEVGVDSDGPGRGSTFWFTLPLAPA